MATPRISTPSQDARLQVGALVAAGVEPRDNFADVTSGSRVAAKRPGMGRLLKYATAADTVVVWQVDRLGRSLIDVLNTVKMPQENGIGIRSVQDGIDPATTTGRLMLNMLATLAEYERELITERVNAGITAARQSGTGFGRPPLDPKVTAEKLAIVAEARAKGRTAAARQSGTGFGRPPLDPTVTAEKLAIVAEARAKGRTAAAQLVGWSRATLYRHQTEAAHALPSQNTARWPIITPGARTVHCGS